MSVATVQLFYAVLAVLGIIAIVGILVLRVAARVSDGARDALDGIADAVAPNAIGLAWN